MKRASVIVLVCAAGVDGHRTGRSGIRLPAAQRIAPKVAIVVGPAGSRPITTGSSATKPLPPPLKFTPNVVRVYSPDATWPAVKQALNGASIVVYLGHGNGWPSRYRDELTPSTQNGMGLNPARRRRRRPPVLRRGPDRQGDQAREGRRRRPQPPLLRERQLRARAARGDARDRPAARRQLRRRLHQGRRGGGHRRGPHGARVLRPLDPRRQEHDRPDLA